MMEEEYQLKIVPSTGGVDSIELREKKCVDGKLAKDGELCT
jgi:hypothetical protein